MNRWAAPRLTRAAELSEGCHKRTSVGSAMQTPLEGEYAHHELRQQTLAKIGHPVRQGSPNA